jgi:atypical dual specificity phosphatase
LCSYGAVPGSRVLKLIFLSAGVRGVINTCEEFSGPQRTYAKHGIAQIRLPCIDYCSPTLDQIETAMKFIAEHVNRGESVYSKSQYYVDIDLSLI